jgi:hypothetical protein
MKYEIGEVDLYMSVHNVSSMQVEVPNLVKMNEIFEVYDTSAAKYAACVRAGDLHVAAEHLQVMARLDKWFAEHRMEV